MPTKIEWAEETWNPIIGCTKISPGCDNCYAERMAKRLAGMKKRGYCNVVNSRGWIGKTHAVHDITRSLPKWRKPRTIFVVSMGDLFHETVWLMNVNWVWMTMSLNPQHTFLILTKRPERMAEYISRMDWGILPNVWLGVTAENQEQADKRIPILLPIPAAKRFVSIEPMLSGINLHPWLCKYGSMEEPKQQFGWVCEPSGKIDWIICGGESGPSARPMHPDWVKSIHDQCQKANIPFMFKQWGEWIAISQMNNEQLMQCDTDKLHDQNRINLELDPYQTLCRIGKKKAGRELDGKIWEERP